MRRSLVEAVIGLVLADGIAPTERLMVYRGNYAGALVDSLRLSFPAVDKLVGGDCFEGCARRFIREQPPQTSWLYDYGGDFPDFLAGLPELAGLPYLPDVARLEWAVNGALHAPDRDPLDAAALIALVDADPRSLRLAFHPAIRLLQLRFPAEVIWRAVLEDDDATLGTLELSTEPRWLLVERGQAGVAVDRLAEAEWRLTAALFDGETLETALARAEDVVDTSALLAAHFCNGRFVATHRGPPP